MQRRQLVLGSLAGFAASVIPRRSAMAAPGPGVLFLASQSGKPTYDEGDGGGNPFASALIELLGQEIERFDDFSRRLAELTKAKSGGRQIVDRVAKGTPGISPAASRRLAGTRVALVIVNADYTQSDGAQSLPGARADADRVANALSRSGFATQTMLDAPLGQFKAALAEFQKRSRAAGVAVVYTTGHGVEVGGTVHLLMGNFPVPKGAAALPTHAIRLADIAKAAEATRANFVFYGGCRDNPFAK